MYRILITCLLILMTGCAAQQQTITPVLAEPEKQYLCKARILFSDATREFSTREMIGNNSYMLNLGEPLAAWIPKVFWMDSAAMSSGRPAPIVTIGFSHNTGIRETADGKEVFQIGLQFQIFKPTGQSRMDTVTGQSGSINAQRASEEALALALLRLESMLESAGVCRRVQ